MKGSGGPTIEKARLYGGLVLVFYVLTHNLNHALGLHSLAAMEAGRSVFLAFWRFPPIELCLLGALIAHAGLGLRATYRRQSLRMPILEWVQLILGLSVPPLLALHILGTRIANLAFDLDDTYAYVIWAIWVVGPFWGWVQGAAVITTWIHGCIGLYYWLRVKDWFQDWTPVLFAAALAVPFLALTGFIAGAREVALLAADPEWLQSNP